MELSLFLAKAIGLYYIIVSIAYLFNKTRLRALTLGILNNPPYLMLSGFIALIIGILLVVTHNLWVWDWRVIITIIGWLAFLKGISILFIPEFMIDLSRKWMENNMAYYITFLIVLIIGIILFAYGISYY